MLGYIILALILLAIVFRRIKWPTAPDPNKKRTGWFIKMNALDPRAANNPAGRYALYRIAQEEAEDAQIRADKRNQEMIDAMRKRDE
jgi:hypothetical protein